VLCQLPKLDVVGSNPIARYKSPPDSYLQRRAIIRSSRRSSSFSPFRYAVSPFGSVSLHRNREETARLPPATRSLNGDDT